VVSYYSRTQANPIGASSAVTVAVGLGPRPERGRRLRRYHRRGKIELAISWVPNFRHVVVRYVYCAASTKDFFNSSASSIA